MKNELDNQRSPANVMNQVFTEGGTP